MATPLVSSSLPASLASDGCDPSLLRPLPLDAAVDDMSALATAASLDQPSPQPVGPPPNPPFVFPARPTSASAPSSYSRATGRRPRSIMDAQERAPADAEDDDGKKPSTPALPTFSFNPGKGLAPHEESAFLSPPLSPQSPRMIPARPGGHGHKRGGSEFVGGNIRSGEAITVTSTSPTKSESGFASPTLVPVDRGERKGHRHRRSAALSGHDLSKILQPTSPNPLRGNSAPTSPATLESADGYNFPKISGEMLTAPVPSDAVEEPVVEDQQPTFPPCPPASPPSDYDKPLSRVRVGFSDTLEFIPRPLSLVSTDTSSTATARPGHSLSGSISSIISATNSTTADRGNASPVGRSMSRGGTDSRPITAGAVLDRTQSQHDSDTSTAASPRRRNSIPVLASLPDATACEPPRRSPTKAPKRWSFFGLEPFVGSNSPARSPPLSVTPSEPPSYPVTAVYPDADDGSDSNTEVLRDESSDQKPVQRSRSKKKKKRVKIWPGSILTRKSKQRHVKHRLGSRRAPTPPSRRRSRIEDEDGDIDMTTAAGSAMPTLLITEIGGSHSDGDEWQKPRRVLIPDDDDSSYPMIDLDAALGPFNTPLPRDPQWEAAQRASGLSKRPLHSAAGMSRFTGPGMHYHHRRAESAPEMVPFEGSRFGIPRFGSSSTMADVFEEDEEDDDDGSEDDKSSSTTPKAESVSEADSRPAIAEKRSGSFTTSSRGEDNAVPAAGSAGKSVGMSEDTSLQGRFAVKAEPSTTSLHEDVIMEEPHDFGHPAQASNNGFDAQPVETSSPSPRQVFRGKELMPVEVSPLHLPTPSLAPVSPYSMTHSSAFPSPRSPMSYDANRVSTAPSSITEDNFHSLLMGEPGPEVRISVDDIPSLTSSNSTMTRESNFRPQSRPQPLPFGDQQRPASFTSAAFGRRRSSLASLSRLISTSYGERSKLSMEISLSGEPDKKAKTSRTKRLSRMMQFWKPKEKAAA